MPPGCPLPESVWVEPFPDAALGAAPGRDPVASYERGESVELALVAAWQHLPANQRAALLMTDVLGFAAHDAADLLETSTASVTSALQRARTMVADRVPDQSQQATRRQAGDAAIDAAVERFLEAMDRADVDDVVGLLREDATWSMPPQPAWFAGTGAIAAFLTANPFRYFGWRRVRTAANGQPALASYSWDGAVERYLPHAIDVLTFQGERIAAVTTFLDVTRRGVTGADVRSFARTGVFERFGLPATLPA